jgi:hypothetical protein
VLKAGVPGRAFGSKKDDEASGWSGIGFHLVCWNLVSYVEQNRVAR